jgi:hypothetical protein
MHVAIDLAIDSKSRRCDLVGLRVAEKTLQA